VVIKLGFSESGNGERRKNHQDAEHLKFTECYTCWECVLEINRHFSDQSVRTPHQIKLTGYYIRWLAAGKHFMQIRACTLSSGQWNTLTALAMGRGIEPGAPRAPSLLDRNGTGVLV
jgi:hypothetical protein